MTGYWNKWTKRLSLHFLMSLNQACLSLHKTSFSQKNKLCFCQSQVTGLHPEVKGEFMAWYPDGVIEDNLLSFSALTSINLSIYWENAKKKTPWVTFAICITMWFIADCKSPGNKYMSETIKINIFLQCLLI